ncbi:MAG: hypothetical protein ACKOVB_15215, partial [Terrabacter sp.]
MSTTIFERAQAIVSDAERVTQAHLRKVTMPGVTFGLITLDNGEDHTKPNTFGPGSLLALDAAIDAALADAEAVAAVSPAGRDLIMRWEGCARRRDDGSMEAYPDPGSGGDPWTIG